MSTQIRQIILDTYREHGEPAALPSIAHSLGISSSELERRLSTEPKLSDLQGLGLREAGRLLEFYGADFLFVETITSDIREFLHAREKIERMERKAGRTPGSEGGA